MKKITQNKVFNPQGSDKVNNREVWYGNTTNLMELNNVKYTWALGLYKQMRSNFWIPQKVDITQDIVDYHNLTSDERRAFNGVLSFLTFLDSIQTCNLPHIKAPITAPEVSMCLVEQCSQEAMHNESYQVMIETIIPQEEKDSIYQLWRTDKILYERCAYIANYYQQYIDNPTEENYFISLVADYILESIYFYNGFMFNYNLASRGLMPGSADMFKLINRDELSHVRLFQRLLTEAKTSLSNVYNSDIIYTMFSEAVEQEIKWTNHIIGTNILGITSKSTDVYTKYLANIRLKVIGLESIYKDDIYKVNPYAHLERFSDTKGEGNVRGNFFESAVTAYNMASSVNGWDDL